MLLFFRQRENDQVSPIECLFFFFPPTVRSGITNAWKMVVKYRVDNCREQETSRVKKKEDGGQEQKEENREDPAWISGNITVIRMYLYLFTLTRRLMI